MNYSQVSELQNKYSLAYLESLPTLHTGHFDKLKVKENGLQVWLSRMTEADGMPYDNEVTIEQYIDNNWQQIARFQAK
jgi:hypothetical protein